MAWAKSWGSLGTVAWTALFVAVGCFGIVSLVQGDEVILVDSADRLKEKPLSKQAQILRMFRAISEKAPRDRLPSPPSLCWPLRAPFSLSSRFGVARQMIYPKTLASAQSVHEGLDLTAEPGTPVYAPGAGTVRLAHEIQVGGLCVWIDHGNHLHSILCHLSHVRVRRGARVHEGQPVGASGATGRASGPHLHWSLVRTDGPEPRWVDPLLWVKRSNEVTGPVGTESPPVKSEPAAKSPQSP